MLRLITCSSSHAYLLSPVLFVVLLCSKGDRRQRQDKDRQVANRCISTFLLVHILLCLLFFLYSRPCRQSEHRFCLSYLLMTDPSMSASSTQEDSSKATVRTLSLPLSVPSILVFGAYCLYRPLFCLAFASCLWLVFILSCCLFVYLVPPPFKNNSSIVSCAVSPYLPFCSPHLRNSITFIS